MTFFKCDYLRCGEGCELVPSPPAVRSGRPCTRHTVNPFAEATPMFSTRYDYSPIIHRPRLEWP
ncbi:MAG: hypothetical protein OXE53_04150, partial [Deltaproteobacteria bacterium]|nr:hypothetical protein [Deltaproteobacteria bacterium]